MFLTDTTNLWAPFDRTLTSQLHHLDSVLADLPLMSKRYFPSKKIQMFDLGLHNYCKSGDFGTKERRILVSLKDKSKRVKTVSILTQNFLL